MSTIPSAGGPERTRELGKERLAAREAEEQAVRPLLARANLLRIRRQWDEAIAVCTEALRRAPESPSAHSLMGDIYEAQNKLDDAVQWFSMAVDLAPDNPVDREKLERAIAAKRRAGGSAPPLLPTPGAGAPPDSGERTATLPATDAARRTAERTLDWFDRVFPPGRAEGIARLILALCAVLAALLVGLAGFMYLTLQRGVEREGGAFAGDTRLPAARPPAPLRMEVGSTGPASASLGAPPAAPRAAASPVAPAPTPTPTPAAAAPIASDDASRLRAIRTSLERTLPRTLTLADVQYESQQVRLNCDLLVSLSADEPVAEARERILRAAVFVGRTATLQDPHIQRVAVRVRPRAGPSMRGGETGPVFVGESTAALLREADPVTGTVQQFNTLFSYAWWSPALSLEPVPSSTPAPSNGSLPPLSVTP